MNTKERKNEMLIKYLRMCVKQAIEAHTKLVDSSIFKFFEESANTHFERLKENEDYMEKLRIFNLSKNRT